MATAIFNGYLDNDGGDPAGCSCHFDYGYTPSFGNSTIVQNGLRTGATFSAVVTIPYGGVRIYYRAVAVNTAGTTYGGTLVLTSPLGLSGGGGIPGVPSTRPAIVTLQVTGIGETTVTMNGLILDDNGSPCMTRFEYGGTTEYGNETRWVAGGVTGATISEEVSLLSPGSAFHYRFVARNRYGISYGSDMSFSTRSGVGPASGVAGDLLPLILSEV
ncbi:MAG: hypothetical protein WAO71_03625 [Gallionella sp.]